MKIGIIGTGNMGRSLGVLWQELGHEVFFGARDPEKARFAASLAPGSRRGSNDEAAVFGEVLLYSPRGLAPSSALTDAVRDTAGKVIIDPNNQSVPDDFGYPAIGVSLAEKLQEELPEARIVKAFNTMAMETFELCPDEIKAFNVATFIAGNDEAARKTVSQLASAMGFQPIDCGELRQARLIEGAADLIRLLMIRQGMGDANFSIVSVPDAKQPRLGGRKESRLK